MESEIVHCEIDEAALINGAGAGRISYDELHKATDSFSEKQVLDDVYSGIVYKARLQERDIAVKKMKGQFPEQVQKNFIREINNTGNLRHRNLISLIGWCCQNESRELLLVHEMASEGSLDQHLFNHKLAPLSWEKRYSIALGLALGVDYLHKGCDKCVIHRDIKSANVMLGHDWTPKLGKFWLARPTDHGKSMANTLAWGSHYYMAPEIYYAGAKASKASDVYSFGVVALELATGQEPEAKQSSAMPLVSKVWDFKELGRIEETVDARLKGNFDKTQARRLLEVGLWCCRTKASDRPHMSQVLAVLNSHTRMSDLPSKPRDDYKEPSSFEESEPEQDDLEEEPFNDVYNETVSVIDEAPPLTISYKVLEIATKSFSEDCLIGEGSYGSVYRADLQDTYGIGIVAVKKIRLRKQSNPKLIAEINIMCKLKHENLVRVIGRCEEDDKLLLVLELMEKQSLDKHLFSEKLPSLPWGIRYKIARGIAEGVNYLHMGSEKCVIHRDIKPANVMLDKDWTPKLGDFGLARLTNHGQSMHATGVNGTPGYMAPEVASIGKASKKSDVFSFGIIALQLATGRTLIGDLKTGMPLLSWAWAFHKRNAILEAVDRGLKLSTEERTEAERLLVIGLWCCNSRDSDRPEMNDVIAVLDGKTHLDAAKVKVKPQENFFGVWNEIKR